ncbi:MAG: hypothetical protein ACFN0Y_05055 [Lactobacillus sp.]
MTFIAVSMMTPQKDNRPVATTAASTFFGSGANSVRDDHLTSY